jgi:uncharacterized protein (TIGR02594 family)
MRLLAALSLALILCSASAEARSHHRHHHHRHHRAHHHAAAQPVEAPSFWSSLGRSGSGLVSSARAHLGATASQLGLPRSLWCADFTNDVLRRNGYGGTGSRLAKSFLANPRTTAHVGAIAVMSRRGGGHVGIVSGFDGAGNPIIVSGNHGHRVGEGVYSARRILAYVNPR